VTATGLCSEPHKSISQHDVLRVEDQVCGWELIIAICDFVGFTQQILHFA
jgi:hypothetical protein